MVVLLGYFTCYLILDKSIVCQGFCENFHAKNDIPRNRKDS